MTNKRNVEVFTAGCPVCTPTVKTVQEVACPSCNVTVYDLHEGCETNECREAAHRYNLKTVPAVVVDGKLASCCENHGISAEQLRAAGVGVPLG